MKNTEAYLGPKSIHLKIGSGLDFCISMHTKSLRGHLDPLNGLHLLEDSGIFGRSYKNKELFLSQSATAV